MVTIFAMNSSWNWVKRKVSYSSRRNELDWDDFVWNWTLPNLFNSTSRYSDIESSYLNSYLKMNAILMFINELILSNIGKGIDSNATSVKKTNWSLYFERYNSLYILNGLIESRINTLQWWRSVRYAKIGRTANQKKPVGSPQSNTIRSNYYYSYWAVIAV